MKAIVRFFVPGAVALTLTFLSSALAFDPNNRLLKDCAAKLERDRDENLVIKRSATLEAFREIAKHGFKGVPLKFESSYYPTRAPSPSKVDRYIAEVKRRGASTLYLTVDVHFRNAESNGLRPAKWKPRNKLIVYAHYARGEDSERVVVDHETYITDRQIVPPGRPRPQPSARTNIFTEAIIGSRFPSHLLSIRVREDRDADEYSGWRGQSSATIVVQKNRD